MFLPWRFKGYHFQEAGLSFELPKQLAVSDICVRILHVRYDHLSRLSAGTRAQNDTAARVEEAETDSETLGETEVGGMTGEDKGRESVQQSLRSSEGKKVRSVYWAGDILLRKIAHWHRVCVCVCFRVGLVCVQEGKVLHKSYTTRQKIIRRALSKERPSLENQKVGITEIFTGPYLFSG